MFTSPPDPLAASGEGEPTEKYSMADAPKTVFISYAHIDGFDFTRRLAFALDPYAKVFWDRHLETGPFPEQLYGKIEACEYFVLVLSPMSLREDGWCRKEL